jgi:hypothetical protein
MNLRGMNTKALFDNVRSFTLNNGAELVDN